jgi:hypothetical protein
MAAHATGIDDTSGGRPPASINATRQFGSSERRDAITAPAEPPPTITKSKVSDMMFPPSIRHGRFVFGNSAHQPRSEARKSTSTLPAHDYLQATQSDAEQ